MLKAVIADQLLQENVIQEKTNKQKNHKLSINYKEYYQV